MPSGSGRPSLDEDDYATSANAPLLPLKSLHGGEEEPIHAPSTSGRRGRRSPEPSKWVQLLQKSFSWWSSGSGPRTSAHRRAFQCCLLLITVPLLLLVCGILWWGGVPRSYRDIRRIERELPQHRWKDVQVDSSGELIEKGSGKRFDIEQEAGEGYLRFPNYLWGHGFNNILEERCVALSMFAIPTRSPARQVDARTARTPFEQKLCI